MPFLSQAGVLARRAWTGTLATVYPPCCVACGVANSEPHALCPQCWSALHLIERPYCERLGTPFALDLDVDQLISPRALADPPAFDRARAVALYDGTARALIHRLKYNDRTELSRIMARMMATAGRELLQDVDVIVPVPLHYLRLWRRRFNQAALLANEIGRVADRIVENRLLMRAKATRPQVGLTRAQRRENLQGAFRVREDARSRLQGRRALVVDDVMTTGATANAIARVLRRAGCLRVDVLTFATVADEFL